MEPPREPGMTKPHGNPTKRVRQKNAIGAAPPPAIVHPYSHADAYAVIQRKVMTNGTISLSRLRQGSRVNVLQIDEQTFIVSSRPAHEVQQMAQQLPTPPQSPFAELSAQLRGQPHDAPEVRTRHEYTGPISVPSIVDDAALRRADLSKSQRSR